LGEFNNLIKAEALHYCDKFAIGPGEIAEILGLEKKLPGVTNSKRGPDHAMRVPILHGIGRQLEFDPKIGKTNKTGTGNSLNT
jgi:hypothetical protein